TRLEVQREVEKLHHGGAIVRALSGPPALLTGPLAPYTAHAPRVGAVQRVPLALLLAGHHHLAMKGPAVKRHLLIVALTVIAALVVFMPAHAAPAAADRLLLHASDLPHGFTGGPAKAVTNAVASERDHVPVAAYNKHGR